MIRWIAKLKNLPILRKVFQREQLPPPDAEFLRQAVLEAWEKFPNDPIQREINAENELFMRKLLGRRTHDA